MEWSIQDFGAIGEIVGGIGVIASLLYLSVQIRQNSRSTKAEAVQAAQQSMVDLALTMAGDPFYSAMTNKAHAVSFLNLSEEERGRLGWFWFAVMRTTETLYHHYLQGSADVSIWETYARGITQNLRNAGFRQWWRNLGDYGFSSEFTSFVNATLDRVETSGDSYEWFGSPS